MLYSQFKNRFFQSDNDIVFCEHKLILRIVNETRAGSTAPVK